MSEGHVACHKYYKTADTKSIVCDRRHNPLPSTKVTSKAVLVHGIEVYTGNRGKAPLINFGTKGRRLANFTPRPITLVPTGVWVGPRAGLEVFERSVSLNHARGSKHGTIEPAAQSLYRLNYYRSSYDNEKFSYNGNRGQSDRSVTLSLIPLHNADSPPNPRTAFVECVLPFTLYCWIRTDARQRNNRLYAQ